MSMKQYSNHFSNFTVTKVTTENTRWDSKKDKYVKLPKPKVTKEVVFAPKDLYEFGDVVRACDIVSDSEGTWYVGDKDHKRILKVEFELEVHY
tara:strand:- start:679 stop:957 length:279 start_codon:yes stop_codon:yes gene_type:complete